MVRRACFKMCESVERLMGWCAGTTSFQGFVRRMLLKPDVTAALSHDDPAIPPQRPNHAVVAQARDFGHTAISMTSAPGESVASSSTGSRYSSMASWMLASASSRVSPSLIHPGREGTRAVKPPSLLGSSTTRSFIRTPSNGQYNGSGPYSNLTSRFSGGAFTPSAATGC